MSITALTAERDLRRLEHDQVARKGLLFLFLDASKSNIADAKSRKDRLDRAQCAAGFISPIYFPHKATRIFISSFNTPANLTYLDLFERSFAQRVKEGSACTGHELAPLLQTIFEIPASSTDEQNEEYLRFNSLWQSLSDEQKNKWTFTAEDVEPPVVRKGKGRRDLWPF
ncbi:hypothetical protein DFJ77DRAFT_271004 [Powellomyces hirtus]|nr:hypothetical protein DFJ77DRAFT_271004 [Powellomyces hirtus]